MSVIQYSSPAANQLVNQFLRVADDLINSVHPSENQLATAVSRGPQYDRALRGLRLLSRTRLVLVINALNKWYRDFAEEVRPRSSQSSERDRFYNAYKKACCEVIYLQVSEQLLEEWVDDPQLSKDFDAFYVSLQDNVFKLLVIIDDLVVNELNTLRAVICARVLGIMGRMRLRELSNALVKQLVDRITPKRDNSGKDKTDWSLVRNQIVRITIGMRHVALQFSTVEHLEQAVDFLLRAHPLKQTAPIKKSQIHHALCEMMTTVLSPLIRTAMPYSAAHLPKDAVLKWASAIAQLKADTYSWMNKHVKHIQVGYPLFTVLVCVSEDEGYLSGLDTTAEFLLKKLKEKELRSVCIRCLSVVALAYMVRVAPRVARVEVLRWLDKVLRPVLMQVKKGFGSVPLQDVLDVVTVLVDAAPEYLLTNFIPELLASDVADCIFAGLRALHICATYVGSSRAAEAAPLSAAALPSVTCVTGSTAPLTLTGSASLPQPTVCCQSAAEGVLRSGTNAFELLGVSHLLPTIQSMLGRLLTAWHGVCNINIGRDVMPVQQQQAITHMVLLVKLLPFTSPDGWMGMRALDLLPSYTAHMDDRLRVESDVALHTLMRSSPHLRGLTVMGAANYAAGLPDDNVKVLRDALSRLTSLLTVWQTALKQRGDGELTERTPRGGDAATAALTLDVHRLEGIALVALCNADECVRREALQLLSMSRQLHQTILAASPYESVADSHTSSSAAPSISNGTRTSPLSASGRRPPAIVMAPEDLTYVMELVEQAGPDIVRRCYWDFGDYSDLWRDFRTAPEGLTLETVLSSTCRDEPSRLRLTRCLMDLFAASARMCGPSAAAAQVELSSKLRIVKDAQGRLMPPQDLMEGRRLDGWRNISSVACVLPPSLREQQTGARRVLPWILRDLIRVHLHVLYSVPVPALQAASCLALGHLAPEALDLLVDELPPLIEEYMRAGKKTSSSTGKWSTGAVVEPWSSSGSAKAVRPEELRRLVAHMYRFLSSTVPAHVLSSYTGLRTKLLDFLRDMYYMVMRTMPVSTDSFWDVAQVAYCMAMIVRNAGVPLMGSLNQSLISLLGGAARLNTPRTESANLMRTSTGDTSLSGAGTVGGGPINHGACFRKLLLELFGCWNVDGLSGVDFNASVKLGIAAVLSRQKDQKDAEGILTLRNDLLNVASVLEHASRLAMATLLAGPMFDSDVSRPNGPILTWIDSLFKTAGLAQEGASLSAALQPGPPKPEVARAALLNLVENNPSLLSTTLVNGCYNSNPHVSKGYLQVLSEVYSTRRVNCSLHVLVCLVLFKMVDVQDEVRLDAYNVFNVLNKLHERGNRAHGEQDHAFAPSQSARSIADSAAGFEGVGGAGRQGSTDGDGGGLLLLPAGADSVTVVGSLQDCFRSYQLQVSFKMSREHDDMSESLCEEITSRLLDCRDPTVLDPMLKCVAPWVCNLVIIPHWKGTRCERLLKNLYHVTLLHGTLFAQEVERVWMGVGAERSNIVPILDFLLSVGQDTALLDVAALQRFFGVAKRICLFLLRASSQQTMDHIVFEASLFNVLEDDSVGTDEASLEFSGDGPLGKVSRASSSQIGGDLHASTSLGSFDPSGAYDGAGGAGGGGGLNSGSHAIASSSNAQVSGRQSDSGVAISGREDSATAAAAAAASAVAVPPAPVAPTTSGGMPAGLPSLSDGVNAGLGLFNAIKQPLGRWLADEHSSAPGVSEKLVPAKSAAIEAPRISRRRPPVVGGVKPLMVRPELALCLLSEVAFESDQDMRAHLPLMLNIIVCCLDHTEALVASHAQQLLINLLYGISAAHMEKAPRDGLAPDCGLVMNVIHYLQAIRGRRLWAFEEYKLRTTSTLASEMTLEGLVCAVVEALHFEKDIQASWSKIALTWALECRSRHLSCRSYQVFRALRTPLSVDLCATLLCALQHCFLTPSLAAREVSVEVINTVRVLVERLVPGRIIIYPQLFWLCLSLLHTPHVHQFVHALHLMATVSEGLKLHQAKVQAVLLACAPGAQGRIILQATPTHEAPDDADTWYIGLYVLGLMEAQLPRHQSLAVQQLLIKGLAFSETQLPTVKVLTVMAEALALQGELSTSIIPSVPTRVSLPSTPRGAATINLHSDTATSPFTYHSGGSGGVDQGVRSSLNRMSARPDATTSTASSTVAAAGIAPQRPPPLSGLSSGSLLQAAVSSTGASGGPVYMVQQFRSADSSDSDGDGADGGGGGVGGTTGGLTASAPLLAGTRSLTGRGGGGGGSALRSAAHFESLRKHRALKLDSFQTLLGPWQSQLFISLVAIVPFHMAYHEKEGTVRRSPELTAALTQCLSTLARAALLHDLPDLAAALEVLVTWRSLRNSDSLDAAISRLCVQINRSFFPKYSRWFLYHCAELLQSGRRSEQLLPSVLLLLRCMFRVEGLRLSQVAAALLESGLSGPIAGLAQGSLSRPALDAIAAIMAFAQQANISLDTSPAPPLVVYQQQQDILSHTSSGSDSQRDQLPRVVPVVAGGTGGTGGTGAVLLRTLHPPPVSVAASLRKVIDTLGSAVRRRRDKKLMPYLGFVREDS